MQERVGRPRFEMLVARRRASSSIGGLRRWRRPRDQLGPCFGVTVAVHLALLLLLLLQSLLLLPLLMPLWLLFQLLLLP